MLPVKHGACRDKFKVAPACGPEVEDSCWGCLLGCAHESFNNQHNIRSYHRRPVT